MSSSEAKMKHKNKFNKKRRVAAASSSLRGEKKLKMNEKQNMYIRKHQAATVAANDGKSPINKLSLSTLTTGHTHMPGEPQPIKKHHCYMYNNTKPHVRQRYDKIGYVTTYQAFFRWTACRRHPFGAFLV